MKSARPLRVLHLGVGNRGLWPLQACAQASGYVSAALCDVDAQALTAARKATGLSEAQCFASPQQALDILGSQLDCAIICTPTRFHVFQSKLCLEAGLSVLVEKGMAPSWEAAQQLVAATQVARGRACVAQNYRFNTVEQTLRAALTQPDHPAHPGRVHQVTYSQQRVRPEPRTLDYPHASVWDMSCHHFDTLSFWFGKIVNTTAFAWRAPWSAYEHCSNTSAHIEYEDGLVVHYLHTHDAARACIGVEIHGERGCLRFCEPTESDAAVTFSARPREQFGVRPLEAVTMLPTEGEADLLGDCHAYFTRGRQTGISVENNLETMAACEMMVRSIEQGRTVSRAELDS